ncbi:MAG: hypothetical protein H6811_01550 [Phycisphaeraceae bacterium]|nr:hypothetical protein [Phycisphaeraceae bacterium]
MTRPIGRSRWGFTLLEVLIVVVLATMLAVVGLGVLSSADADARLRRARAIVRTADSDARAATLARSPVRLRIEGEQVLARDGERVLFSRDLPVGIAVSLHDPRSGSAVSEVVLRAPGRSNSYEVVIRLGSHTSRLSVHGLTGWAAPSSGSRRSRPRRYRSSRRLGLRPQISPSRQSGLTLLETVAAAALLAVITISMLPHLRAPVRSSGGSLQIAELSRSIDRMLADPNRPTWARVASSSDSWAERVLPVDGASHTIRLRVVRADDRGHGWIVFECEGVGAVRWIRLASEPSP